MSAARRSNADRPDAAPADWRALRERGSVSGLYFLTWVAVGLGRGAARLLLWPIVLFFFATGAAARAASREYLRRVWGRPPRLVEVFRHFYVFAACALDRLLLLSGRSPAFDLDVHLAEDVRQLISGRAGCLMLVAHVGSFEMLRDIGGRLHEIPLRIVLDRRHGAMFTGLLERLNPQFASAIIDAGRGGPELVLAVSEALAAGCSVGIMADRRRGSEAAHAVRFLGGVAQMPAAPWSLALVLRVPIVAAYCLYQGGRRYALHFDLIAEGRPVPRSERAAVTQQLAQRYADSLERHLRTAPYNWFNFYPYWTDEASVD